MFSIRGTDILLTRGDSAHLTVAIRNEVTGADYTLLPADELHLTVRRIASDDAPELVHKKVVGAADISLTPEDTADLRAGLYVYDVELRTGSDVYTVIPCSEFRIMPEVTTQ